jgi:hypothetical protein
VPTKPIKGLGRHAPDATDDAPDRPGPADRPPAADRPPSADRLAPADRPPPKRTQLAPDPHRKGGISFDDDDLNEYMHPDDVPPKAPPRDPGDGDA